MLRLSVTSSSSVSLVQLMWELVLLLEKGLTCTSPVILTNLTRLVTIMTLNLKSPILVGTCNRMRALLMPSIDLHLKRNLHRCSLFHQMESTVLESMSWK